MADKQLARSGTADFDILSDDDPLAELARIVGYENRPAIQQLQELERHRETVRQEPVLDLPVLNLEDELLREFDVYDAPESRISVDAPPSLAPDEYRVELAPPAEEISPSVAVEPEIVVYDAWDNLPDVSSPSVEIEPSRIDAAAPAEPEAVVEQPVVDFWSAAPEPVLPEPESVWSVEHQDEPVFDGSDLERELELSIGYEEYPTAAPQIEAALPEPRSVEREAVVGVAVAAYAHDFGRSPVSEAPVSEEPIVSNAMEDLLAEIDQPSAAAKPGVEAHFELPRWEPEPASVDILIPATDAHGMDDLLADVARFPVPAKIAAKLASPPEVARKVNYPFTPTFSRATPVASNGGVQSQKAFATPLPAVAAAVTPQVAYLPEQPPVEPPVIEASPALKTQTDPELDFDLDTFELDLSDIELDIDPSEFEVAAEQTDPLPARTVAEAPVSFVAPTEYLQEEEEPVRDQTESALPFDPSMITDTEESLSVIGDLNVPHLPAVEQERPVVLQPDYDLDIDAEMAQLFGTPGRGAAAGAAGDAGFGSVQLSASQGQPAGSGARVEDDFEEFEKAMEEDFRLSLSQRHEADPSSDRLAVGSGYSAGNDFDEENRGAGKRRLVLLAAAVAGLAIFGGVGVYAYMVGTGSALSGGEPKIILADKSPVKMVPVEKGGTTVPNQDKAVYDRVAGAQDTTPQQDTLVSSTEEPIDVVQRTLTPENLPLEGAGDDLPGVSPADDEGGERLLPDAQAAENAVDGEDSAPAVSPRKVRTMIVKPDGTLVAREEPVAQPVTNTVATGAAAKKDEPQVTMVKTTTVTPQTQAATKAQPVPAAEQTQKSALAEAADATVEEVAPVRSVKTTAVADAKPASAVGAVQETVVPVKKVEKPVDTFKTQPVAEAKPAETKPVETASVAPGTYVVQIASLPSEADAQKSYQKLSGKFGSVIAGKGVDIKRAEIAGKGTYFRVRIPAGSKEEANALCSRYKSAGGSCLVTK